MATEPLLAEVRAATEDFLGAIRDATGAQWTWKPGPGIWSLQETAEHTCVVQKGVERLFTTRLLDEPITEESPGRRWTDSQLAHLFDSPRPIRAPEMVHPKGRWTTQAEIAATFTGSVDKLADWVRATQTDLRAYGFTHPLLGMLDGIQWLIFTPAHTRHHRRQLQRIRETPGFPGGEEK